MPVEELCKVAGLSPADPSLDAKAIARRLAWVVGVMVERHRPTRPTASVGFDTIRLRSPPLDRATLERIRSRLDFVTGFDASQRVKWQSSSRALECRRGATVFARTTETNLGTCLTIEGSVHKLMLGHNVLGSPRGIQECARRLVAAASRALETALPKYLKWSVCRVDAVIDLDLGESRTVRRFFQATRGTVHPRRLVVSYGVESLYVAGKITAIKLYDKGREFRTNSRKSSAAQSKAFHQYLKTMADRRLRIEVEIKAPRLKRPSRAAGRDYQTRVSQITDGQLDAIFDAEVHRLMRSFGTSPDIVRSRDHVLERLRSKYSAATASNLFDFWFRLSSVGETEVREEMPRSTYLRKRGSLQEAGVAWQGTDVPDESGVSTPVGGFSIHRGDSRRCLLSVDDAREIERSYGRHGDDG
jgi:II/X family phage/plasmid replication protein